MTVQVSVITPAFNAASTLLLAIHSVQKQSFSDWEMIVVDDGSTDRTGIIAAEAAEADPRIRVITQKNQGVAAARNAAIDAARGRYIAFLDSDDQWLPFKLKRQLDFMVSEASVFSFTAFRKVFEPYKLGPVRAAVDTVTHSSLLRTRPIGCSTVIIDSSKVRVRMPVFAKRMHEDLAAWLDILKTGVVARGLNEELCWYSVRRGARSHNKFRSAWNVWRVYREHERMSLPRAAWCFSNYAAHSLASIV